MADPAHLDDAPDSKQSQSSTTEDQAQQYKQPSTGTSVITSTQANPSQQPEPAARITKPDPGNTNTLQRVISAQRQPAGSINGLVEGTRDRLSKSGTTSPSWPTSPRLKSPPPNAARSSSRRDSAEQTQSNTAKRLAPVSAPELAAAMLLPETTSDSAHLSSQPRGPPRIVNGQNTGLETVVEGSVPTTPSTDSKLDPMSQPTSETNDETSKPNSSTNPTESSRNAANKADNEPQPRAPSTSRPPNNLAKRSFTNLTGPRKATTEPLRTMEVETAPVTANTSGLGERNRDAGSIRTKTSTETIRPKKERKKPTRKTGSLHPGGLASKADIFEAKVASAVDEADSDDSDETFVYESNPPESRRHHSRTPSATSLASNNDYRANKHGIRNGSAAIPGKRSMKFGSSMHTRESDDDPSRAVPRNNGTARHHHIGRYGRNAHPSLFDADSPFAQSRQLNSPRNGTAASKNSRPSSPRVGNGRLTSPRKYGVSAYDNNEDVADDERAPLVGTVRRNRHSRRPHSQDFRSLEMGEDAVTSCGTGGCRWLLLIILALFVCTGISTFLVAVNRPLYDVEIHKIMNVLASEQELMLDLDVKAVNPNLFAVTVTDLDINLFAESPYAGTSMDWHRHHPSSGLRLGFSERRKRGWLWPDPPTSDDGVDRGTDPDDPEGAQKMLLGRVCEFDSPLTFEPAPMRRISSSSVGEIRLTKPGNKTEVGGSERWERVLLHDFDLIVRGVIKYQLPLGSKVRSAKVGGRKTVHPDNEERIAHGLQLWLEDQ